MENWKEIMGFEGRYEVSDQGRIRNLRTSRILKPYIRGKYLTVAFRRPGVRSIRSVHSVVLEHFVGPRPDGYAGAHLDGQISNNALSNLAWVTPEENERHKIAHGTHQRGTRSSQARFTDIQVAVIREASELGLAISKIATLAGVNSSTIHKIIKREHYAEETTLRCHSASRFDHG